jgi:hypothetical protein
VYASPELNKCLLGYVMDGKVKMIAVKDSQGKTLARSMAKILWCEEEQKPYLFVEKTYFAGVPNEDFKEKITQMAEKVAKKLGINYCFAETCKKKLESFGNRSPWEYSDASSGVTDGIYTVSPRS